MKKPGKRFRIEVANRQSHQPVDEQQLRGAVREVLGGEKIRAAEISLAVVDDVEIHEMNRRYLAHDEPTDVLTFVLESSAQRLEGEIIVSADTAAAQAARLGTTTQEELVLYVVHGTLHLAGYDDLSDEAALEMRKRERLYLGKMGIQHRWQEPAEEAGDIM